MGSLASVINSSKIPRGRTLPNGKDFQNADVLGEDVFGSPKPHPNAVLKLFEAGSIRFAIPFAAYRAAIGGFSVLMSDKPGTVLPRRTLATTVYGVHVLQYSATHAARIAAYGRYLRVCPDKACALSVETAAVEERIVAMENIYSAVMEQREGGLLSPPSLGRLPCERCAKSVYVAHAAWGPHTTRYSTFTRHMTMNPYKSTI